MGREIERKFLVKGEFPHVDKKRIYQAYINTDRQNLVFVEGEFLYFVRDSQVKSAVKIGEDEILGDIQNEDGSIITDEKNIVRVRLIGDKGLVTLKGAAVGMIERPEYNYPIEERYAKGLIMSMSGSVIIKDRFHIKMEDGHLWEVDSFIDPSGLILAEIELDSVEEEFVSPEWLGEEVTQDKNYCNNHMVKKLEGLFKGFPSMDSDEVE